MYFQVYYFYQLANIQIREIRSYSATKGTRRQPEAMQNYHLFLALMQCSTIHINVDYVNLIVSKYNTLIMFRREKIKSNCWLFCTHVKKVASNLIQFTLLASHTLWDWISRNRLNANVYDRKGLDASKIVRNEEIASLCSELDVFW